MLTPDDRVFIAGHNGLVGSALVRFFKNRKYDAQLVLRDRQDLDLLNQQETLEFFESRKPTIVILAAAKVGGILANQCYPTEFLYENSMIQNNVIHASHMTDVREFLFLGSSCVYPKNFSEPIRETDLLSSEIEETNRAYAVAKISGIELCRSLRAQYGKKYTALMPTNLYGPNDNFDLQSSHVLPALIRKIQDARIAGQDTVELWGDGSPLREFLHVDDLASACFHILEMKTLPDGYDLVNIGSGEELSIAELALLIADVVGWNGQFVFDSSRPNGVARKKLDCTKMSNIGWQPGISLRDGIAETYGWYLRNSGFPATAGETGTT